MKAKDKLKLLSGLVDPAPARVHLATITNEPPIINVYNDFGSNVGGEELSATIEDQQYSSEIEQQEFSS